jgi:hypothetical protein
MLNHVVLVGNLGSDPEVRTVSDRQKVTRLSVATHEIVTKRTGERERQTEWHQVVAWGALGERAAEHLRRAGVFWCKDGYKRGSGPMREGTSTSRSRSTRIGFSPLVARTREGAARTSARASLMESVRRTAATRV